MKINQRYINIIAIIKGFFALVAFFFLFHLDKYIEPNFSQIIQNIVIFSYLAALTIFGVKLNNIKIAKYSASMLAIFTIIFCAKIFFNFKIKINDSYYLYIYRFSLYFLFCFLVINTTAILLEWEYIFDNNIVKNIHEQKIKLNFAIREINQNIDIKSNLILINEINTFFKLEISNFESIFKSVLFLQTFSRIQIKPKIQTKKLKIRFQNLIKIPRFNEKLELLKICRKSYYDSSQILKQMNRFL